ncbi:MAG: hypothetical protein NVSMB25_26110 [Thermoleophilaceae bacterium]
MFFATLVCSDPDCTSLFEATGALADLETLSCDCDCALVIVDLSEGPDQDRMEVELVA